jgi:hypothetical protein
MADLSTIRGAILLPFERLFVNNLFYKLISTDGSHRMRVYLKEGKRGFNIGVSVRKPNSGVKGKTGFQATYESFDAAKLRFDELVATASSEGWLPRGEDPTGGRRTAFTTMPTAPGFVKPIVAEIVPEIASETVETVEQPEAAARSGSSRRR